MVGLFSLSDFSTWIWSRAGVRCRILGPLLISCIKTYPVFGRLLIFCIIVPRELWIVLRRLCLLEFTRLLWYAVMCWEFLDTTSETLGLADRNSVPRSVSTLLCPLFFAYSALALVSLFIGLWRSLLFTYIVRSLIGGRICANIKD